MSLICSKRLKIAKFAGREGGLAPADSQLGFINGTRLLGQSQVVWAIK